MPETTQNFANHARLHKPFVFVLTPLLFLHLVYTVVRLVQNFTLDNVDAVLLAVALIVMGALTRVNPLKVQDRVIRLEERLRYQRVLSPTAAARAEALTPAQVVALRFAPDAELPGLVEQTLAGQFAKPVDIKKAIRNWRGDEFRV